MKLYLTSSPTGTFMKWHIREFDGLNPANGMVDNLKKDLPDAISCLMIAATPDAHEQNDRMLDEMKVRLEETGFEVKRMEICDDRNPEIVAEKLAGNAGGTDHSDVSDLIILGGGHVPTQNVFFKKIGLREKLQGFEGVVMGISAGSMNSADVVYAQPEEDGESTDPNYERFISGLGLTKLMVIPHYNVTKDFMLDGKRVFEDITYPDSMGRDFIILTDGSYVLEREGAEPEYCGEIYRLADGVMERV